MLYVVAVVTAIACLAQSVVSTAWIPTAARAQRRNNDSSASRGFVTARNGKFQVNGRPFFYFGTDAYWLHQLSDHDIDLTLKTIASKNITVVRTWAFNDVFEIPTTGAWFQAFNANGTVTVNTGVNGLQRIDKILASAKANGLRIQLALTNNWGPLRSTVTTSTKMAKRGATNVTHPPGFLSNDYGGMDAYVHAHGLNHHDQFFANQTLINAFEHYLKVLIPRYKDNTELLAWELANDARCGGTLPASIDCRPQTVTRWHATLSEFVKQLDPNHLVASGTQGFFCVGCPKLFPLVRPPQASPLPGQKRRATGTLTAKRLLAQRRATAKRNAEAAQQRPSGAATKRAPGEKVKWTYRGQVGGARSHSKRQALSQALGPSFDGSQGVDSQDILNIPAIGFSTFQLFPDQNQYAPTDPNLDAFNNTVAAGVDWIQQQAASALTFGKPAALTGFGLVTQNNLPAFVPFNSSQPLFPAGSTTPEVPAPSGVGVGVEQNQVPVTDDQQEVAYARWIQAALASDISGITQYQWGQGNLTSQQQQQPASATQAQTFTPSLGQQNESPNDGYQAISSSLQNLFHVAAQQQEIKNT